MSAVTSDTEPGSGAEAGTGTGGSGTGPGHAAPHPAPVRAEDRGQTTIQPRVIEAIAVRIVGDEPGVGGVARRMLGAPRSGADPDRAPRVEAMLAGDVVALRVRLSVSYPAPVHAVTDRLRHRLIERVEELTGKQVGAVEIVVAALHRPDTGRRVVR